MFFFHELQAKFFSIWLWMHIQIKIRWEKSSSSSSIFSHYCSVDFFKFQLMKNQNFWRFCWTKPPCDANFGHWPQNNHAKSSFLVINLKIPLFSTYTHSTSSDSFKCYERNAYTLNLLKNSLTIYIIEYRVIAMR